MWAWCSWRFGCYFCQFSHQFRNKTLILSSVQLIVYIQSMFLKRFICFFLALCMGWNLAHAASDHHHTHSAQASHAAHTAATDDQGGLDLERATGLEQANHGCLHACVSMVLLPKIPSAAISTVSHACPAAFAAALSQSHTHRIERPQWSIALTS